AISIAVLNALAATGKQSSAKGCSLYFYALVLSAPVAVVNVLTGQAGFLFAALHGLFWLTREPGCWGLMAPENSADRMSRRQWHYFIRARSTEVPVRTSTDLVR